MSIREPETNPDPAFVAVVPPIVALVVPVALPLRVELPITTQVFVPETATDHVKEVILLPEVLAVAPNATAIMPPEYQWKFEWEDRL